MLLIRLGIDYIGFKLSHLTLALHGNHITPSKKTPKDYTNAYPRLLPHPSTKESNDKLHFLFFIKHNNAEEKIANPFSFSFEESKQFLKKPFTISFSHTKKLTETSQLLLGWSFMIGMLFFLTRNGAFTKEDLHILGGLFVVAFIALFCFIFLIIALSNLIPYAFAFTKNIRNIKLLVHGIGTEATFIGPNENLISNQLQFSYFTEDGTYQTLTFPSAALSDIDELEPGDKKLLFYLSKDPTKGILYDLIPFAPKIDSSTGEFIAPNMKDFEINERSSIWMILYALSLVWLMILAISSVYVLFSFFLWILLT